MKNSAEKFNGKLIFKLNENPYDIWEVGLWPFVYVDKKRGKPKCLRLSTGREVGVKKSQFFVYVECERPLMQLLKVVTLLLRKKIHFLLRNITKMGLAFFQPQ